MDKHWRQYQGALLWNGNPSKETPTEKEAKEAIKESGAMFARWTSHWDCGTPTEWWWCIKDTPFDIQKISSNYRYKINKGNKHFDVHIIDAENYAEDIYQIQVAAFSAYPELYRPHINKSGVYSEVKKWKNGYQVFGAFAKETGLLCGYTLIKETTGYAELLSQKTIPYYEKLQINAALVYRVITHYNSQLSKDFYIVDGERNIKHQTHFFQYLMQYFEFRLAYCHLHIVYSPKMQLAVNLLYPFIGVVKLLVKFNFFFYNVYCVLRMEKIRKSFK